MDVRRLRSFVQIADCGSITKAAAEAGLAQPALSQHLAALELELGVRLLERSATGVKLTTAGRVLYDRAQVILQELDDLREDVQGVVDRIAGPVAIGLPPSMVDLLTMPLLETLCREHPALRPQVLEEGSAQLVDLLTRGALEIAVSPMRPDNPAVDSELLFREPLVLAAPRQMRLPHNMDLAELARLPWVTTRRRHAVRVMVDALFAEAGLEPRVVAEIDSLMTVVRSVEAGLGVAVMPQTVAEHARGAGALEVLTLAAPLPQRSMFLCWRKSTQSMRRTQFVLDLIRRLARDGFAGRGS